LTRLGAVSFSRLAAQFLLRVTDGVRAPSEELVNPASGLCPLRSKLRGVEPTSLAQPFPSHLGLSLEHRPAFFRPPSCIPARLAFAGRMLPDATLRGMRRSRSHGGIAPPVAGWSLLSEASSPSSFTPCQGLHAGRGADTPPSPYLRVVTVTTRTAPAFRYPYSPRYVHALLSLLVPPPFS